MTPRTEFGDGSTRETLVAWLLLIGAVVFAALLIRDSFARGRWRPVATVMSGTGRVPQESEDALLLLRDAASVLPEHVRVAFVKPTQRNSMNDHVTYSVALGQLSRQKVLPPSSLETADPPEFVLAFGGDLNDARYSLDRDLTRGRLYRRLKSQ